MIRNKKVTVSIFLTAFLMASAASVFAAEKSALLGEGRYFVASNSTIVRTLFGAHHEFEDGFTTDLTKGELWTLDKIFRISVSEVPIFSIDEEANIVSSLDKLFNLSSFSDEDISQDSLIERENSPANQVSWGVKLVYGEADLASTTGGDDISIAILDTGAEVSHPDIAERIVNCMDFTRSSIVKDTCEDKNGHGTHITGIVASDGGVDKLGMFGVAPGAKVSVYKTCLSNGACWADDVAVAISYAVKEEVNIISMSFGGSNESNLVKRAIDQAYNNNILTISSVGNADGDNNIINFPASYARVVGVGAIDEEGNIPEWSRRGTNDGDYFIEDNEIDLVAPGVDVESTWLGGEYRYLSGTSLAAPFVTGLAAKLWDGSATSTRASLQFIAKDVAEVGDDALSGFGVPVLSQ